MRGLLTFALVLVFTGCAATGPDLTGEMSSPERENTGTITSEDLEGSSAKRVEDLLEGRVAGVHVSETPGGGVAVLIRGANFIQGSNEPLYVIDGFPAAPGPGGELTGISKYEIASIEVLKGTAAMAQYGSRGVNGVIVVETKQPPAIRK